MIDLVATSHTVRLAWMGSKQPQRQLKIEHSSMRLLVELTEQGRGPWPNLPWTGAISKSVGRES